MEKYNIIKLNNQRFGYLIIANTYENPINDFLADERVPEVTCGEVLFDLTLIHGIKPNRYVVAHVDNAKINFSSIQPINDVGDEIKEISKNYFRQHTSLIENSVLPNALKYSLLNL